MKKIKVGLMALGLFFVGGCGQVAQGGNQEQVDITQHLSGEGASQGSSTTSTDTGSSTKESSSETKPETSAQASSATGSAFQDPSGRWNKEKADQLRDYILNTWGPEMGQTYREVTLEQPLNYYGVTLPQSVMERSDNDGKGMYPAFSEWDGGMTPYLRYSPSGFEASEEEKIHVVAIYSDIESTPMGGHLYLFVVKGNLNNVLITQQDQGNPENKLYFKTTRNTALREYFANLVGGYEIKPQGE